jgi:hypothetical protein
MSGATQRVWCSWLLPALVGGVLTACVGMGAHMQPGAEPNLNYS